MSRKLGQDVTPPYLPLNLTLTLQERGIGGVILFQPDQAAGLTHMAECVVEEFARMGYSGEALLALFRDPFYAGPHAAYQALGEERVRQLIQRISGTREEGERV